jgi:acetyltransferase-like isoleucine patch superfamily enzyme
MPKQNIKSRIKFLINRILYQIRFIGQDIYIHPSAYISSKAVLKAGKGGRIEIGADCEIHDYAMVLAYGGKIIIGSNTSLNPFSIAYGHGGLRIGSGVIIAAHVIIIPANHILGDFDTPLRSRGVISKGISIQDNVWLGTGVKVLDGVKIGSDAVVGAGSIVTKNIEAGTTVVGIPAKKLVKSQ